jgi:hypothetical protein
MEDIANSLGNVRIELGQNVGVGPAALGKDRYVGVPHKSFEISLF